MTALEIEKTGRWNKESQLTVQKPRGRMWTVINKLLEGCMGKFGLKTQRPSVRRIFTIWWAFISGTQSGFPSKRRRKLPSSFCWGQGRSECGWRVGKVAVLKHILLFLTRSDLRETISPEPNHLSEGKSPSPACSRCPMSTKKSK